MLARVSPGEVRAAFDGVLRLVISVCSTTRLEVTSPPQRAFKAERLLRIVSTRKSLAFLGGVDEVNPSLLALAAEVG